VVIPATLQVGVDEGSGVDVLTMGVASGELVGLGRAVGVSVGAFPVGSSSGDSVGCATVAARDDPAEKAAVPG
jgi:hypothetical protein